MNKYYSFDRIEGDFKLHETREEAKASTEKSLQLWREEAINDGWPEFMGYMIGYGKTIGLSTQTIEAEKKDYTDEEWEDLGYSLDFERIGDYQIKEIEWDY